MYYGNGRSKSIPQVARHFSKALGTITNISKNRSGLLSQKEIEKSEPANFWKLENDELKFVELAETFRFPVAASLIQAKVEKIR